MMRHLHVAVSTAMLSMTVMSTALWSTAAAAVPTTLTYAGVLTDNGARVEGTHDVIFELFDDDVGGTSQYSEQINGVVVIDGELVVELGNNNLDDAVLELPELWLEVTVDGTTLAPRVRLNSVPYALRAESAQRALEATLADVAEEALSLGGILPADVVTTTTLQALGLANGLSGGAGISISAGNVSIAVGGIGTAQLANQAVTTGKIANNAVTAAQLANATITSTQLATNAVATANIADDAVTVAKLADDSVGPLQIATRQLLYQVNLPGCNEDVGELRLLPVCTATRSSCGAGNCFDCVNQCVPCGSIPNTCPNTPVAFVVGFN